MSAYPEIPNIRHLRMAQVIGQQNGVSSAARMLHTSQPAVTQAGAKLEEQRGAPIFDRRETGTYPTDIGRIFLIRVDRFFAILEAGIRDVIGSQDEQLGRNTPLVDRLVTTTQLRSLVVTSDPATVELAAAQMTVSSASLYRSARTLERSLGKPLFEKTANGRQCNMAGHMLARRVRCAVQEIGFAKAEVTQALGREDLEIVVGLLPMAGTYELAGAVRRFSKLRRSARVSIRSGTYHALLDDLLNCRVDFIFGLLRKPEWEPEIEEEFLYRDSYCLVCRPNHPLTARREITPRDMLSYDWIVPVKGSLRRTSIDRVFADAGIEPRCNIEVSSLNCARALLLESDMVTVMSRSETRLDAKLGTLAFLPCPELDTVSPKGLSTRSGWLPTDGHRQFLNCLREVTTEAQYGFVHRPPVALAG